MAVKFCLLGLLYLSAFSSLAQNEPLPRLQSNRVGNMAYMDSLSAVGKSRYQRLKSAPNSPQTDTLKFRTLYFLGELYKSWFGRRDSLLYFSQQLIDLARRRGNSYYATVGLVQQEAYYRTGERDTPKALRINLDILASIPKNRSEKQFNFYKKIRFLTYVRTGSLYGLARDYPRAFQYLTDARDILSPDTTYRIESTYSLLIDLEQRWGAIYQQQNNFAEAEKHYRTAQAMLLYSSSPAEQAYVFDDLAELYLRQQQYGQALQFAQKAEIIWGKIRTSEQSKSWGTLASIYEGLGEDERAVVYAQKILQLSKPGKFILESAYRVLHQVAERRQDWQNAAHFHKKFVAIRDSITNDQRSLELLAIQRQNEYDKLIFQNRQEQQLQQQKFLNMQQQTELDKLRAKAYTDELTRSASQVAQQRQLDQKQAQLMLMNVQAGQKTQQQQHEQEQLKKENELQRNRTLYLGSTLLLLIGGLVLVLYAQQLRKRRAESDLKLAETRNEELIQKNDEIMAALTEGKTIERKRVAIELHDNLGSMLSGIKWRLQALDKGKLSAKEQKIYEGILVMMGDAYSEVRLISHNMLPAELEKKGLNSALEKLVSDINQNGRLTISLAFDAGLEKMNKNIELELYSICLEAVNNILKHAEASVATIQLNGEADYLSLRIKDNGKGIAEAQQNNGKGLKNLTNRVQTLNGTLTMTTANGTLLSIRIPLTTVAELRYQS